eukprot:tig00001224_g7638.t1
MEYDRFLSRRAKRREPSAIVAAHEIAEAENLVSLAAGLPQPDTFPVTGLSFTTVDDEIITLSLRELDAALQYSASAGLPALLSWIEGLMRSEHGLAERSGRGQARIAVTDGSLDALSKVFDALIDEGDSVLVEDPTYPGALSALRPLGCKIHGVRCDKDGMDVDELDRMLGTWSEGPLPRVLYCCPTAQNPTGRSLSFERRFTLLEVASRYDLLVIEDDPYYFLQLDLPFDSEQLSELPSLLSLDTAGRVVRIDSLSFVFAPGLRLGWATGPREIMERVLAHQQASTMHASGVSQVVAAALLNRWGPSGWLQQIRCVQEEYRKRRDTFDAICEKHLTGLASWRAPVGGLFFWIKLEGVEDSGPLLEEARRAHGVVLLPGRACSPSGQPSPFVRAAFRARGRWAGVPPAAAAGSRGRGRWVEGDDGALYYIDDSDEFAAAAAAAAAEAAAEAEEEAEAEARAAAAAAGRRR